MPSFTLTSTSPFSDRTLTVIGILVAVLAAVFGMFIFYTRYEYAEVGHDYLVVGYLIACFAMFFAIRFWKMSLIIIALFFIIAIQIYSGNKFSWRENYIASARAGQPFQLGEYIERFPTYEEYTFTFLKNPDWVRFNRDCVQPALQSMPVDANCASLMSIQDTYNIDIVSAMKLHYGKMKRTAKMIEEGQMTKRTAYADCIASRSCVNIPLLPKGVDANALDPTSQDYLEVRQAFWSLINDANMSPEVCKLVPLCTALVKMKVVDAQRLPF